MQLQLQSKVYAASHHNMTLLTQRQPGISTTNDKENMSTIVNRLAGDKLKVQQSQHQNANTQLL